jgi:hypothetical protein
MTATNKRLLISESHGDSNRCTPCRGKPDQHATCFSRSVRVWSKTIRISRGPHKTTFCKTLTDLVGSHCPWEKGLLTQSTACGRPALALEWRVRVARCAQHGHATRPTWQGEGWGWQVGLGTQCRAVTPADRWAQAHSDGAARFKLELKSKSEFKRFKQNFKLF